MATAEGLQPWSASRSAGADPFLPRVGGLADPYRQRGHAPGGSADMGRALSLGR